MQVIGFSVTYKDSIDSTSTVNKFPELQIDKTKNPVKTDFQYNGVVQLKRI